MSNGRCPSYVWRSILTARAHLLKGIRWHIDNGSKNNPTGSESSSTSSTSRFWTHLWGLHTAPKVKLFLWRLYNNILPTRKNLSWRITSISPCCAMCPKSEEDILHIFFRCRIATETWSNLDFSRLVNLFLSPMTHQAILEQMISWPAHDSARFAYFLCCIWNCRNNMIFQHIPPDHSKIILQATDVSVVPSVPVGGISCKANSHSPEHAEMIAIWEGLCLAKRFGYTNYIIESNCKVFIDQLQAQSGILSSLGHIHQQILSLVDRQSVVLSFSLYDANIPTHLLAAQSVSTYLSNVWFEVVPYFISTVVQADLI
ncbi:hypothetical protein M9H77_20518 [Catharanthus roseus]|uniref:Uncharacterized protein n=1 Tax=Catharanthus roseus TaxID=4058 RepID=A0ACC0AJZ7_CATRO|nr:hypothetical protein M9H77_20518 [Catharanthus roseus]